MRIFILLVLGTLLSSFTASAMPLSAKSPLAKQSFIQKVQIQRACRRGYDFCRHDAYDRRAICLSHARWMPRHKARRYRSRCHRIFRSAMNRCKKKYCTFYSQGQRPDLNINRDRFRHRR